MPDLKPDPMATAEEATQSASGSLARLVGDETGLLSALASALDSLVTEEGPVRLAIVYPDGGIALTNGENIARGALAGLPADFCGHARLLADLARAAAGTIDGSGMYVRGRLEAAATYGPEIERLKRIVRGLRKAPDTSEFVWANEQAELLRAGPRR